jgi:probable O-glycosylation ligase (exosortase A-associated)
MLRNLFVFLIIAIGVYYAAQGPFYALLFYLWNAYFRPEQWVWGDTVASLNLSLIIGAYLVATTMLFARAFVMTARTGLLFAFFVQTIVSTVYSEHFGWSWTHWVEFSKVMLVSYLIVVLVTDRRRFRLMLLVAAYSLGFEAAKQGWVQLFVNPGGQNNNIIPFLGDNNGVALGMMMLTPIFTALARTAKRRPEAFIHWFFLVGVFMRGITTYSRGGFLAAAVLGAFTFYRSAHKIRAVVGIAVLAVLVSSVMPQKFWDRMRTINASSEERDSSAAGRLHFWEVAMVMARAKPLAGVGFNGFEPAYATYETEPGKWGENRSVHSLWFGLLAELGYPGLLLFTGILLMSIWSCRQVVLMNKLDPSISDLGHYAQALSTSFFVLAAAGTFLPAQYSEVSWNFIGMTIALHSIAVGEKAHVEVPATEAPAGLHPIWPTDA